MAKANLKIFSTGRIKFNELYEDALSYLKRIYKANNAEFTVASPFAQIINVLLNLGRLILFYIENSITELNIKTAYHPRSVQGLATLTGHSPFTGIAARGTLNMCFKNSSNYLGKKISIKNYTKVRNKENGLGYMIVLPSETLELTGGTHDSKIEVAIIQGDIKYQRATGTGEALQSFNFANKNNSTIDNFFLNIYVNGEYWQSVTSILDMGFNQKACIVKPSLNSGIDVFFGTGTNGAVPEKGASIICEYIVSDGIGGNVYKENSEGTWIFEDPGYDFYGDTIDLNGVYSLTQNTDVLFGAYAEDIEMTRKLAPHMSRCFVLANETNYKTFLERLNIFSKIHVFSGFNTYQDNKAETDYTNAKLAYASAKEKYLAQVNLTGKNSTSALELYDKVTETKKEMDICKVRCDEEKMDDNTVYMYLIPDITKRIDKNENYFTCRQDIFTLTDDEKEGLINLIDNSGQRMITVDNRIIDPIFVRFALNIFIQMWAEYDFNSVKSAIVSAVSEYLITNERMDRLPISDIIRIVENVDGVDSVTAFFDADKNNANYFGAGNYGIDNYGDIVLKRTIQDTLGNNIYTTDLYPLFRGPFTSPDGVEYSDGVDALVGPINITLRGKTKNNKIR